MAHIDESGRRTIEVGQSIPGGQPPRAKCVPARKRNDFPGVPAAFLDVAEKLASPLVMGPPLCEELVAVVRHLFTEEEAGAVRHLGTYRGHTARQVAAAEHRPVEQVQPILERLATEKRAIAASGPDDNKVYRLPPIMPGIFEMVLVCRSMDDLTDWHRRFAELFEALYETGYSADYRGFRTPLVRFLPVHQVLEAHPMALPCDRLETILDRYDTFGVGQCQCRIATAAVGRGCGKPTGNCTVMGHWAERAIETGTFRQVSKAELLAIKFEAESHGMVNWLMNVDSPNGQCSCSCCGCCCHAMRVVNEFNVPGTFAPPHYLPRFDPARCTSCGKCARACPMKAIVVETVAAAPAGGRDAKTVKHLLERCIGCGLCAVACDRQKAIAMDPVPKQTLPYRSWYSLIAHAMPSAIKTSFKVWRSR
jgi:Na+-translocating ferredoxin:NAD+ oxidoreductase subunit B